MTSFTIASLDESSSPAAKLSDSQEDINGQAVSTGIIAVHPPAGNRDTVNRQELANIEEANDLQDLDPNRGRSPPPRYPYPASEASGSTSFSTPHTRPAPPPFFDLYEYASAEDLADDHFESLPSNEKSPAPSTAHPASAAAPAYAPRATSSAVPPTGLYILCSSICRLPGRRCRDQKVASTRQQTRVVGPEKRRSKRTATCLYRRL
ncbi:hypothetical protein PG990_008400 [Apiospora arundinis]